MNEIKAWKIISSELVFDHQWYKLRKDVVEISNGRIIDDYFVSVRPEVVTVFPVTEEGDVILVEQYKHGAQEILLEFPGGVIEGNEDILLAAERELVEETGYKAERLVPLNSLIDNPTKDTNRIHLFIALGVRKVQEQQLDDTENINVVKVPLDDIMLLIRNGDLRVAGAVSLAFLALDYLRKD